MTIDLLRDPRVAAELVKAVDRRVDQILATRLPAVRYGVVESVGTDEAAVYIGGAAAASPGFRFPAHARPRAGDLVRVVIEPTGDRYVAAIGPVGWQTPTFTNGWTQLSPSSSYPVGYLRDSDGFVWLRGLAAPGTIGFGASSMFTLPVGYRPPFYHYMIARCSNETGHAVYQIQPTGDVRCEYAPAGTTWVSLDTIRIPAF